MFSSRVVRHEEEVMDNGTLHWILLPILSASVFALCKAILFAAQAGL